jgi:hypothetical protein
VVPEAEVDEDGGGDEQGGRWTRERSWGYALLDVGEKEAGVTSVGKRGSHISPHEKQRPT